MEFSSKFVAVWTGSYFDLYEKMLHIEVWDWNKMATNNFIASKDVSLVSIARGSMTQECEVAGEFKDPGKKRKELRCAARKRPPARRRRLRHRDTRWRAGLAVPWGP